MNRDSLRFFHWSAWVALLGLSLLAALMLGGCSNSQPSPKSQTVVTLEDVAIEIDLSGGDGIPESFDYEIKTQPKLGNLEGRPPLLKYQPHRDSFGSDSFSFVLVPDGSAPSEPVTVNITVQSVNDPPTASPLALEVLEDGRAELIPVGSDSDGVVEDFELANPPRHGTATSTQSRFEYVPNPNFNGSDSFDYIAVDNGGESSAPAIVSVTVTPVNDTPQAHPIGITTPEDTPATVEFDATDAERDSLEFRLTRLPEFGNVVGSKAARRYVPNPDFHGNDSFEYVATDSAGAVSNSALVSIEVEPTNDPPSAHTATLVVSEDSSVLFELKSDDPDGSVADYKLLTTPSNGVLSGSGSMRTYSPHANFHGSDSFQFMTTDEFGSQSNIATVTISVEPTNDPPTAEWSRLITAEDSRKVSIPFKSTDQDGQVVRYEVVRSPRHGSVLGQGLQLTYTPNADFWGDDSFEFVAIDDLGLRSNTATVAIDVVESPDPPSIFLPHQDISTYVGETIDLRFSVTDPDGDAKWFNIDQRRRSIGHFLPSSGRVRENRTLRFEATKRGTQSYRITVEDETGLEDWAIVTIHVRNSPPVFERPRPRYNKSEGTIEFTLNARDPDGSIDYFVIETIDGRTAKSIAVDGDETTSIEESKPFEIGGDCHEETNELCTFKVTYTPDNIDGHSRRIRFFAVDDEGLASKKDFVRVETRNLLGE